MDRKLGLLMAASPQDPSQKHPTGLLPIPALQDVVEELKFQVNRLYQVRDAHQNEKEGEERKTTRM